MTEYWVSQARKFCDMCKCWIADNRASVEFHESGKRHKEAVAKRLTEIQARGAINDKKAAKEEEWIKKMEADALKDYRTKDLGGNADITAKIFNQKREEREANKKAIEEAATKALAERAVADEDEDDRPGPSSIGPQIPSNLVSSSSLHKVEAPKSGTKWHKDSEPKKWYEAVTEDGNTYFWHVETQESRWEAPPEGFFSIKEQEEVNRKHEAREEKKIYNMYQSQSIHGSHLDDAEAAAAAVASFGPDAKVDPYGSWKTVAQADPKTFDYQTPRVAEKPSSGVTLHSDRVRDFKVKATPSLGGHASLAEPVVFKKRKMEGGQRNVRQRIGDD